MAGGYRSALPVLGLSAPAVTVQAGYRSHLWRWGGGASSRPAVVQGGYRSLLAFWTGGAFAGTAVPPTPPTPANFDGHGRRWEPIQDRTSRLQQDDELIALFLAGFSATANQ